MSVYKHAKTPFYQYDFVVDGRRFLGSTKTGSKKEALGFEAKVREQAKKDLPSEKQTGNAPLTLDVAAGRDWSEVGQYHVCAADTWRALNRLIQFFGKDERLAEISDGDVSARVAWRRRQTRWAGWPTRTRNRWRRCRRRPSIVTPRRS